MGDAVRWVRALRGGQLRLRQPSPDGLPVWTEQNREVRRRDIVLWVNVGLHHLTRAEDQPVMPTVWHSFKLRPLNFFNRNPALDLKAP